MPSGLSDLQTIYRTGKPYPNGPGEKTHTNDQGNELVAEPANTKREGLLAFDGGDLRPPTPVLAFLPDYTLVVYPRPSASSGSSSLALQLEDQYPAGQSKDLFESESLFPPIFGSTVAPHTI